MAGRATSDIRAAFGAAIRVSRRGQGLSQERLAELAGLHRTYVGDVERGERNVSLINIERLSEALGLRPSDLLRRAESMDPSDGS